MREKLADFFAIFSPSPTSERKTKGHNFKMSNFLVNFEILRGVYEYYYVTHRGAAMNTFYGWEGIKRVARRAIRETEIFFET